MSEEQKLREAILRFVEGRDHVSFPELQQMLRVAQLPADGDQVLETAPNVVLWAGLSAPLAACLQTLLREKALVLEPTPLLVYLVDGAGLTFPLAKRPPRQGYAKPHWLPVVLRPTSAQKPKMQTRGGKGRKG